MSDVVVDGIDFDTTNVKDSKYYEFELTYCNINSANSKKIDIGVNTKDTIFQILEEDMNVYVNITCVCSLNETGGRVEAFSFSCPVKIAAGAYSGTAIINIDDYVTQSAWDIVSIIDILAADLDQKELDQRTGDFINTTGYFKDKQGRFTKGYLIEALPGGYAGQNSAGRKYATR